MNLDIPVSDLKTTEVDLILIHETGIYVFEIKHYAGSIHGNDTDKDWVQYSRTGNNSVFHNPVLQNNYHIQAIRNIMPDTPLHSFIVFTNSDCALHTNNSNPNIDICRLDTLKSFLELRFASNKPIYSLYDIDDLFTQLAPYSHMIDPIDPNNEEACFLSWIDPIVSELENAKKNFIRDQFDFSLKSHQLDKARHFSKIITIAVVLLCFTISTLVISLMHQSYNNKIATFEQKFMHIDQINNPYITNINACVQIQNIKLKKEYNGCVTFKARISLTNYRYGFVLTENPRAIVLLCWLYFR